MKTCQVEGCDGAHIARGYCTKHYQRAKRAREFTPQPITYRDVHEFLQTYGVMAPNGCWEWSGKRSREGYGQGAWRDRYFWAHRLSYETYVGPIPDGLTIDHLCRNPACMRPDHLEPVSIRVNTLRGNAPTAINARKTHCKYGHEFTPENTKAVRTRHGYMGRACRACGNANSRRYRSEKRSA